MLQFITWYLLISLLGWLTFPLAYHLFPALADRGFSLARALGMLAWGYVFWMLASLGLIQNDGGGLFLAFTLVVLVSGYVILRPGKRKVLGDWIKSNLRLVVTVEILFFLAFASLAFVRACNPEIASTEKPMELAFINAIMRSPTSPPRDPWLSGYAISYYYFGYVMTAMLAKVTATTGSVAFNLMLALIFALSAVGAYGLLYNLLAAWHKHRSKSPNRKPSVSLPWLGPFFLLIVSNFEGFLDVLHNLGLFWKFNADGSATSSFWNWLGILDLNQAPVRPFTLIPERNWWWWRASRVIQDLDLAGKITGQSEIIDEFPFFSYLLGDLHPHVLAMPFDLLALAVALNLFQGGWKGESNLIVYRLPVRAEGLIWGALILGGLAFLNTWDILVGFALFAGAYALARALENGWSWERLRDIFALSIPVGLMAILFYLPFYIGFSSQAGGILPNLFDPTRGVQLWVMFGPFFLVIFAYLVYLRREEKRAVNWKLGLALGAGAIVLLWAFSWILGMLALRIAPGLSLSILNEQCGGSLPLCFGLATLRRFSYFGGVVTLFILLGVGLAFLIKKEDENKVPEVSENSAPSFSLHPFGFLLLLTCLGAFLILAPDFVFLRDQFGWRLNTVFKFYYQAWLLLSVVAAFGAAVLLQARRSVWNWIFRIGLFCILLMALVYPVCGLLTKTKDFQIPAFTQAINVARKVGKASPWQTAAHVWTLDGGEYLQTILPDDLAAAIWLRSAPDGNIVEATRVDASYNSEFALISTYSGLPTILGWPGHESQWRGTYDGLQQRMDDIKRLYETKNWDEAQSILSKYAVRYVYIGTQEHNTYKVNTLKFQQHLVLVFNQKQVVIYEMP
jgi:YYY domain-containing protein